MPDPPCRCCRLGVRPFLTIRSARPPGSGRVAWRQRDERALYQAHEPLAIVSDLFVQVLVCGGRRDPGKEWIVHFGRYLPWNRPVGMHPAKVEPMPGVDVARGRRTTNNTEVLVCI